jgi:transposase-like protein
MPRQKKYTYPTLTDFVITTMAAEFKKGKGVDSACRRAGVSRNQFYFWQHRFNTPYIPRDEQLEKFGTLVLPQRKTI